MPIDAIRVLDYTSPSAFDFAKRETICYVCWHCFAFGKIKANRHNSTGNNFSQRNTIMAYTYTTWSPELATGHTLIDNQHQQWIAAVNNLFDAYRNGKGRKEVERTMDFLVAYTIKHFSDEEKLQKTCEYPHYLAHQQIHADFKGVAQDLASTLRHNGPTDEFISHVCVTIGRWVINHIKNDDLKMAAHIRSKEQNA